ncbi:MAG: TOBE domain-containing protein [Desulfobaccales bacterium]
MKVSAENVLKGKVVEINRGMLMTNIKVVIGDGDIITAIVTDSALKELDPKVGDDLEVLTTAGVMTARCWH